MTSLWDVRIRFSINQVCVAYFSAKIVKVLFANNIFNEKCSPERAFLRKSALCKEHFRDDRFRNGSGKSETLIAGVLAPGRVGLEQTAVDGE